MVVSEAVKPPARGAPRGNNLDDVRRNNLSAVLTLVHTRGAVSRAVLTRETGLNRSTIGALVAELVSLDLVYEADPDTTNQVGRPSPVIMPSQRTVALAVNPELDSVTIGLVALGGNVVKRVRYDTLRIPSVEEVVNIVGAVVAGMRDQLDHEYNTVGLGLAVPGLVRASDGLVNLAPHLGWHQEPVSQMLQDALGLPVYAANDAAVGATAESMFGAGKGMKDMIYLNGGASGIGGGVVIDGHLMTGSSGYAGELGHTLVNSQGVACHCGSYGCLETEVSRGPLLAALGLAPNQGDELEQALIDQYADPAATDPAVAEVVDRQLGFLAVALKNAVNLFNPQLIVLGGFLGTLYEVAPERLQSTVVRSAMMGPREAVQITRAALGRDLLVVGASQLAFAQLLADPARYGHSVAV
ncbi:ROK family protein [Compostimonas suwonensis]|uniref:Putative NBD/HSP70 family sugar kinase n=1 Tax=Compostimonas suwonensis TaxID=1048394 RepID=A0A2M9BCH2_9MICO|nr:ROK family protein [Compostimonas suwonensis]PJJ55658.1 putative NBD/HSP70 family sugar kinase [Compostimonas suwonensis]